MFLASARFKNFRSFADFTVSFHAGLNLIVGENNIGKSNLLDGIRLALGPASLDRSSLRAQRSDLHRGVTGAIATEFEIVLEFKELTDDDLASFLDLLEYDPVDPKQSVARISYRWSWDDVSQRYSEDRWGGGVAERAIKAEVLQSLPAAYLEPLRDAQAYLSAGRGSRISTLLSKLSTEAERAKLVKLMKDSSKSLRDQPLIARARAAVLAQLHSSIGPALSPNIGLAPTVLNFPAIAQSIRATLRVPGSPDEPSDGPWLDAEIAENGMGYNNLLFIATVLAYRSVLEAGDVPIVLIEEPEAHLHPQLQLLLADFLASESKTGGSVPRDSGSSVLQTPGPLETAGAESAPEAVEKRPVTPPQVFLTSHSPNLASHLPPDHLIVLHRGPGPTSAARAASIRDCGLADGDLRKLQRLLDATKASLFFARGVILVEGITEQLLLPVLARRCDVDLAKLGVSVVALHGLGFQTVLQLFGTSGLTLPCAVLTDADPPVPEPAESVEPILPKLKGLCWRETPSLGEKSSALRSLEDFVAKMPRTLLRAARVTLEHELAAASEDNAKLLVSLFPEASDTTPEIFTLENLRRLATIEEKARFCWQAICRKDDGKHKGSLSQVLAFKVSDPAVPFTVPPYLAEVFDFMKAHLLADSSSPTLRTDEPPSASS